MSVNTYVNIVISTQTNKGILKYIQINKYILYNSWLIINKRHTDNWPLNVLFMLFSRQQQQQQQQHYHHNYCMKRINLI